MLRFYYQRKPCNSVGYLTSLDRSGATKNKAISRSQMLLANNCFGYALYSTTSPPSNNSNAR